MNVTRIVQEVELDDYVIATVITTSIRDMVKDVKREKKGRAVVLCRRALTFDFSTFDLPTFDLPTFDF